MNKYSKLIAGIIGGVVGLGGLFGFSEQLVAVTPEMQAGLVTVLSMIAVFFAPKNNTDG